MIEESIFAAQHKRSRVSFFFTAAAAFFLCAVFSADAQNIPLSYTSAAADGLPENITFWSNYPAEQLAAALVSRMSNEDLLAQIFMFGWAGQEPPELLNRWVLERGLGSVKVFGWNTDNTTLVAESVISLQKKSQQRRFQIPLFVATDQEGGWIRHVKGETSDTPGNLAIGASGYAADAWFSGYYISRELRALGINMNFAPTVDLYTNHESSVIGPRSFGDNRDSVGVLGAAFTAGSLAAGVIPTAKHFPGHGDTGVDSHGQMPMISIDLDTLLNRELVPFKYLIAEKIPAIMSGHLGFPQIVSGGEPASLSKVFLTDILRNQLGYEGLIITDDMMMNGATMYAGSLSSAFRMAIEAGNDIIISSTTAQLNEALWRANLELMKTSASFRDKVTDAARRVIYHKLVYFKNDTAVPLYPDVSKISELIPDPEAADFFLAQACRSISVFKDGGIPYTPAEGDRILLVGQKQFPSFFSEAKLRYPQAKFLQFNYAMGPNETDWMSNYITGFAKDFDTVIICVADAASAAVASRLQQLNVKTIIISVLAPFPAMKCDWADSILLTYSYSPYSFAAVFGLLAGEFTARGTLPLAY